MFIPMPFLPWLSAEGHGLLDRHFIALQKLLLGESLFTFHHAPLALLSRGSITIVWVAFASGTFLGI